MILNNLRCIVFNHRVAPVEIREQLKGSLDDVNQVFQDQQFLFSNIQEFVLLSTCNRTELYAWFGSDPNNSTALLIDLLAQANNISAHDLSGYFSDYQGHEAIEHLHQVAAGLDSQVLGEAQILGQVSESFQAATTAKTVGPILTPLCQSAIRAGKRARTETAISRNPASTSSVALALAQKVAGDLQQRNVLVVGLGEMGILTLKAIQGRGITQVGLVNRTHDRAAHIAQRDGYRAYPMEELPSALAWADVVISATASPDYVIDVDVVQKALAQREQGDLLLVDIAVPRDVAPAVSNLAGVYRFDVDDLQSTLDQALQARQAEVPKVEAIIQDRMDSLSDEYRGLVVKPVISDLRRKAEDIRQRELERTLTYLGSDVDPQTWAQIQHFSRALVNKLLHEPTQRLRVTGKQSEKSHYIETVRDLFGLPA